MGNQDYDVDIKWTIVKQLIIIIPLVFIAMQLNGLALEPHVSASYVEFYQNTLNVAAWILILFLVANVYKEVRVGDILGLKNYQKAFVMGLFIVLILSMTLGAEQGTSVIPVPRASALPLQLDANTEVLTSSIIPAFTEDALYLIALPMLILFTLSFVIKPKSAKVLLTLMVISSLIATTGFNIWVIPGFTSAHVPAYGEVQEAYLGAWIFGFGQSMTYMVTGWFVPVAHGLHNYIISSSILYQVRGPS